MKSLTHTVRATLLALALTALGCVRLIRVEPQPITFGEAFYVKEPAVVPQLSDAKECVLVPLTLGIVVPQRPEPAQAETAPAGPPRPEPASESDALPRFPENLVIEAKLLQGSFKRAPAGHLTTASDLKAACDRLPPNAGATSKTSVQVENVTDGLMTVTLYLVARPARPFEDGDLLELDLQLEHHNGLTHIGLRLENGAPALVGLFTGVALIVVFTVVAAAL